MSIRSHRVIKVVYADAGLSFQRGTTLGDYLVTNGDTTDHTNMDGGGIIEFPFRVLKEALEEREELGLSEEEITSLTTEIIALSDKDDDDYIMYDMF